MLHLYDSLVDKFRVATLHCNELSHFQVARFAREVGKVEGFVTFSFISKKETLGGYKEAIQGDQQAQRYYNKCAQYLLEQVGVAIKTLGIEGGDLRIIFEARRGHDYRALRSFIHKVRKHPFNPKSKSLSSINPECISSLPKTEDKVLSFADLIAYSAFQAVNTSRSNCGIGEQRYMRELRDRYFRCPESGVVGGYGVKLMKINKMGLDNQTFNFFSKMYRER